MSGKNKEWGCAAACLNSVASVFVSRMKVLQVALTLKNVSGEFDFDDIEVEFR